MDAPVVVVGLGGVGSHCAHALLRGVLPGGSVRRLRLIDFDRVSLSSLNRHAVALRRDVGLPKVTCCAEHFRSISDKVTVDARDAMFTAAAADTLLLRNEVGEVEEPKLVVDCIDDVKTKVELLSFCTEHHLPVVSALGSGAKDDPTKICIAQGLREIDNDPLATKLRKISLQGTGVMDWSEISFVYSSQKVQRALLPLSEEQRNSPEDFGSVANFRLRVIPVLGAQPAAAGMAIAAQVLNRLERGGDEFWPQPTPAPRRNLVDKLLESFKRNELKRSGGRSFLLDVTPAEASFMVHEVWLGRSALNPELDAFAATGIRFTLTKWDEEQAATAENLILATCTEAENHRLSETDPVLRERVERSLAWAKRCLKRPLQLPQTQGKTAEVTQNAEAVLTGQDARQILERPRLVSSGTVWDDEERTLVAEQLSRSSSFLGAGHEKVQKSFVVIVGVGAVGSSAAILLARAGLGRLRLVDGGIVQSISAHAVATAADFGRPKVEVCKEVMLAVLPHLEIDTLHEELGNGNEEKVLGNSIPDLILDCMGGTKSKELLLRYALQRKIRVISVFTPPALCPADPSRVVVAPLGEVWACPAAVALRARLSQHLQDADIEVIHSQEPGLWAKTVQNTLARGVEFRLQLGVTAAASALLRITGGQISPQADPCGMNFWKKLRNTLERQEPGHDELPDLYAIGCIADYIWRGRSAISSSIGAKHSDMAITRWDLSKPVDLANLVLMTLEEAQQHHAAAQQTGSLPQSVLDVLKAHQSGKNQENEKIRQIHEILQRLREHLVASYEGLGRGFMAVKDSFPVAADPHPKHPDPPDAIDPSTSERSAASIPSRPSFGGLVGETKLVELRCLSEGTNCKIFGKAEFLSPGGCQKDRVARHIIDEAVATGALCKGGTIVEGTSGSTGISLCLAAAALGYKVHVVMPDDQADEKVELLKCLGATVQMVRPASISSPEHYVNVARKHAEKLNAENGEGAALFANQFENPANFRAHYETTGPELWQQCPGLDAFVMSAGTGGTLAGVGRFLKEKSSKIRIVLADVPGSSLYYKVAKGVLYAPEQEERSVRRHRQDTIAEGIGNDRLTGNFAMALPEHNGGIPGVDSAVRVSDQEALEMAHHLLRHEGVFLGSSAAVNCVAAVKVARTLPPKSNVVTILCDSGQRHLTKFYNSTVWPDYNLEAPVKHAPEDLSFVS